jgi:hypothetical protein
MASPSCIAVQVRRLVSRTIHARKTFIADVPVTAITTGQGIRLIVDGECCYDVQAAIELIHTLQS